MIDWKAIDQPKTVNENCDNKDSEMMANSQLKEERTSVKY